MGAGHFSGGRSVTVKELMGHSDFRMTLRYAHLAPEHLAESVEKLDFPEPHVVSHGHYMDTGQKTGGKLIPFGRGKKGSKSLGDKEKRNGGHYWVRTGDFCRVKAALYH